MTGSLWYVTISKTTGHAFKAKPATYEQKLELTHVCNFPVNCCVMSGHKDGSAVCRTQLNSSRLHSNDVIIPTTVPATHFLNFSVFDSDRPSVGRPCSRALVPT